MIKKSFIITILFILSSILGFVCQMLYGKYFGAGGDMDIYYAYNSIPNIITGVLPVVFSSLLIPIFPQYEAKGQLEGFMVSMNRIVLLFSIVLVVVAFAVCLLKICYFQTASSSIEIKMCAIIWSAALFSIMNAFYISYVNYKKKFIQVSLTSLMTYTSILFSVIFFHKYLGVITIVLGLLLGALIRFVTMRNIMKLPHSKYIYNVEWKCIINRAFQVFVTLLPFSTFPAIAYMWAGNMEEGAISYLGYSHSFEGALSVAGSMGIATVSFPDLAKSLNTSDKAEIEKALKKYIPTLKSVFFFSCLIISFCCVFIIPVCSLFLERGEFTSIDIQNLSKVLPMYFISGCIIAELNLIRNIFYSLKRLKEFAFISTIVTLLFLVVALLIGNRVSYIVVGITECFLWMLFLIMSMVILVKKNGNFLQNSLYYDCLKYILTPLSIAIILKYVYDAYLSQLPFLIGLSIIGVVYTILTVALLAYVLKGTESKIFVDKLLSIVRRGIKWNL